MPQEHHRRRQHAAGKLSQSSRGQFCPCSTWAQLTDLLSVLLPAAFLVQSLMERQPPPVTGLHACVRAAFTHQPCGTRSSLYTMCPCTPFASPLSFCSVGSSPLPQSPWPSPACSPSLCHSQAQPPATASVHLLSRPSREQAAPPPAPRRRRPSPTQGWPRAWPRQCLRRLEVRGSLGARLHVKAVLLSWWRHRVAALCGMGSTEPRAAPTRLSTVYAYIDIVRPGFGFGRRRGAVGRHTGTRTGTCDREPPGTNEINQK